MTLSLGARLGPYEVVAPLGAGGMGEVYRARDTRLGREVAIKVLPAEVASDPERLRRFDQEARAASALNHPNILTVHDLGAHDGVAYLVTELLEGESLRDLLRGGPLQPKRAAALGAQLARGLAAAHEKGIVHRDLKPENLFVTGDGSAKILDFGLARVDRPELAGSSPQEASTVLETSAGTVLGSLGYMAPEQVRGERADARSDLFSLGVVLHELVTGANPFRRDSVVESLNAILKEPAPELDAAHAGTSPAFARIVERLLAKDPARRFRSAADLAFALEGIGDSTATSIRAVSLDAAPRRGGSAIRWLGVAALFLGVAAGAFRLGGRSAPADPAATIRFEIAPPPGASFSINSVETRSFAVSPDGRRVAYVVWESGGLRIWVRPLDALEARPLEGTEGASSLAWSPDGGSLVYFTPGKLRRIGLSGGAPVTICDVTPGIGFSASWGAKGDILFASVQGDAIFRVPATGGTPEPVAELDTARGDQSLRWPVHLPGGEGFLYVARREGKSIALVLRDGAGLARDVGPIGSRVEFVGRDWLLFAREGALLAQRFDRAAGRLDGSPVAVAPKVRYFFSTGWAGFGASTAGTILYSAAANQSRLLWFDRGGNSAGELGSPGDYLNLAVAPDGRSVLVDRTQPEVGTFDLFRMDFERGVETRLTTDPDADFDGVWLPDGKSIVYSSIKTARSPVLVRRELASGTEELLLPGKAFQSATDVTRDGRTLAFSERGVSGKFRAFTTPLDGERRATELLAADADERDVRFSPDGRYVAYLSDLSGTFEAYVTPVASPAESTRISSAGGRALRWSRDGREIVVLGLDGRMISVTARFAPELELGAPQALFRLPEGANWTDFDMTPDGRRFLAVVRERSAGQQPAVAIVGWRPETTR